MRCAGVEGTGSYGAGLARFLKTAGDYNECVRRLFHPRAEEMMLASVLSALADPVRLGIVRTLGDGAEHTQEDFDASVAQSTLSHHMKKLRDADVVAPRRAAPDGRDPPMSGYRWRMCQLLSLSRSRRPWRGSEPSPADGDAYARYRQVR